MTNQPRGELVPGGLAMVIGYKNCPENLGMVVTTVEFVTAGHVAPEGGVLIGGPAWFCAAPGLSVKSTVRGVFRAGYCYISPKNLMPINPSADPLEIKQNQEIEEWAK